MPQTAATSGSGAAGGPVNQMLKFSSKAVDDGVLQITSLEGHEEMNKPYEFVLELVSTDKELDFANLLQERASIHIKQGVKVKGEKKRSAKTLKIHGWLSSFEQVGKQNEWAKYRAVLVPGLWKASLNQNNKIFQDMHAIEAIEAVCQKHGWTVDTGKVKEKGPVREYIAQYEESDLDFINRWCEHEGIFYYFLQEDEEEKLVFATAREGYGTMQGETTFRYKPDDSGVGTVDAGDDEGGTPDSFREEIITAFASKFSRMPKEVVLKDYNWKNPDADMVCTATVNDKCEGTVYEYNNHYASKADGDKLAKVRAEALICREQLFTGRGDSRGFRAGLVFALDEHFRDSFNQEYLLTKVSHRATQSIMEAAGAGLAAEYSNTFVAIPESKTFRPERVTPWPQIKGVMHGLVDGGDASTPYSQTDDMGRYKIKLGYDKDDADDGQASKYIRKSEPYAGPSQGMHFPLLRGSEVLITHVDGDPDRPVISGAVFNGNNPSVMNNSTPTINRIATPAATQLVMDDTQNAAQVLLETKDGKTKMHFDATTDAEKITIETPKNKATLNGKSGEDRIIFETDKSKSKMRLGKEDGEEDKGECKHADGIRMQTDGEFNQYVGGDQNIQVQGKKHEKIEGTSNWTITDHAAEYKYGDWFTFKAALSTSVGIGLSAEAKIAGGISICVGADVTVKVGASFSLEASAAVSIKKSVSKDYILDAWKITTQKNKDESVEGNYTAACKQNMTIKAGQKVVIQGNAAFPPGDPSLGARMKAWAAGVAAKLSSPQPAPGGAPPAPPPPPPSGPSGPPPLPRAKIEVEGDKILLLFNTTTFLRLDSSGIKLKCGSSELVVGPSGIDAKPMVKGG